ncbi:hypothetical protein Q7P35_009338 [Cladosporium inversicolor]
MAEPPNITAITNSLARATLGDGAIPTEIKLPNNIKPKAAITSLTTMFEVVWYKASRKIWLQYATPERAVAACEALHGKHVAGVYIRCHVTGPHHRQPVRFNVELLGMPDHIDLTDIRPRLPGRENPDGLSYGNLSYQADVNALHYICEELEVIVAFLLACLDILTAALPSNGTPALDDPLPVNVTLPVNDYSPGNDTISLDDAPPRPPPDGAGVCLIAILNLRWFSNLLSHCS